MKSDILNKIKELKKWQPPAQFKQINVIDAHTGGEPLRIITDGLPEIKGRTILEKRRYLKEHLDDYRKLLMWEPRGHADMYGAIITEPVSEDSDFGIIFLHNEGYSSMCGHGIIAVTKVAVETGLVSASEPETRINIDSPAGQISAYAKIEKGKVKSVSFHNVPSYVVMKDKKAEVPGLGSIRFDIAFGGAYYAFVKAADAGVEMTEKNYRQLIVKGMAVKQAVMEQYTFSHPFESDLSFLYGTIFTGPGISEGTDSRNVCVFADGEVDRSPTGTGVSARMALHYSRGEIKIGEEMVIESIVGSRFVCSVFKETDFGGNKAVIPQVEGSAFICGKNTFIIDPEDPFPQAFFLH